MVRIPASPSSVRREDAASFASVDRTQLLTIAIFVVANVALAMAMRQFTVLATIHALASAGAGALYAIRTRRVRNIAFVLAYLAGSEVMWRMCRAAVFYEFGKYTILTIALIGIVRVRGTRNRGIAFVYVALLLPSAALTFATLDFDTARQAVAFTLSGPVTIALAVAFFSNIELSFDQLWRVFIGFIGPVAGIAALTILTTRANSDLDFGNGSNVVTSGGFGPNQVSAMLGLATLFLLLISLERRLRWDLRAFALAFAFAFAALSALTFSRGGIVLALVSAATAVFVLLRGSARGRLTVAFVTLATLLAGKYVIEPKLESITNGKLSERYTNTKSSGRDIYAGSELRFFEEHPVLGVGPGIGTHIREEDGMIGAASHTEYSRMLGEHGLLGLFAMICLVTIASRAIRLPNTPMTRAYATSLVVWTGLFLLIYSTRLAAPALVFGLAFTRRPLVSRKTTSDGVRGAGLVAPVS